MPDLFTDRSEALGRSTCVRNACEWLMHSTSIFRSIVAGDCIFYAAEKSQFTTDHEQYRTAARCWCAPFDHTIGHLWENTQFAAGKINAKIFEFWNFVHTPREQHSNRREDNRNQSGPRRIAVRYGNCDGRIGRMSAIANIVIESDGWADSAGITISHFRQINCFDRTGDFICYCQQLAKRRWNIVYSV